MLAGFVIGAMLELPAIQAIAPLPVVAIVMLCGVRLAPPAAGLLFPMFPIGADACAPVIRIEYVTTSYQFPLTAVHVTELSLEPAIFQNALV
jgi:hypothetical protein